MARVMREKIRQELAEELLFGRLSQGGQVVVGFDKKAKKLSFDITTKNEIAIKQ